MEKKVITNYNMKWIRLFVKQMFVKFMTDMLVIDDDQTVLRKIIPFTHYSDEELFSKLMPATPGYCKFMRAVCFSRYTLNVRDV